MVGKDQNGYITPAFLGFPIVGRHEQETKRCLFSMEEWCLLIEPFSQPHPQFLGALLTLRPPDWPPDWPWGQPREDKVV